MKLEVCEKCPIYNDGMIQLGIRKTCKVEPRFISNPNKKRIIIFAEAPGQQEDYQNKVLVGRSGKLLDELLITSGLAQFDIRLSNVVKCRPIKLEDGKYKNRTPIDGEIECCRPYLEDDFSFNPDLIILLGRIPTKAFFPNQEPSAIRGKGMRLNYNNKELLFISSYHPSACLYNANNKPILLRHLTNIANYLNDLK